MYYYDEAHEDLARQLASSLRSSLQLDGSIYMSGGGDLGSARWCIETPSSRVLPKGFRRTWKIGSGEPHGRRYTMTAQFMQSVAPDQSDRNQIAFSLPNRE